MVTRRWRAAVVSGAVAMACVGSTALGELRIVTYNTAADARTPYINTVLQAIGQQSVNGVARPIDVLVLQEQDSVSTDTQAVLNVMNSLYGVGTYARGNVNGGTTGGGRMGIVYRVSTVQLVSEFAFGATGTDTAARQTLQYQLRPVGYDAEADFFMYVSHYKASNTTDDKDRRLAEATQIRAQADGLGQGASIIYAGDFNMYTSTEAGYQKLLSAGNGQAFDPINTPGAWSNSSTYKAVHTQSPATSQYYSGQITGGMDDRFDFQLISGELLDNEGMSYISGSYRAFGNNGTHSTNGEITSGSGASASVLDALKRASDHLPVVADYQRPARMSVTAVTAPTRVMQNGSASAFLTVTNSATASVVAGADELDYTISGGGAIVANINGSDAALGSGNGHNISLSTATIGPKSGTITVNASSAGVPLAEKTNVQNVNYSVLGNRVVTASAVDFGRVIVGATTGVSTTLSTTGNDDSYTRVTVNGTGTAADGNGVSVTAGGAVLFNGAGVVANRNLSGTFGSVGLKNGSRPLDVSGEGLAGEVVNGVQVSYAATVLHRANASFAGGVDTNTLTIDFGTIAVADGPANSAVNLYNLAGASGAALTAALDLDFVNGSGDTGVLGTSIVPFMGLNADGALGFNVTFTPGGAGAFAATYTLHLSDENVAGEGVEFLTLNLVGTATEVTLPPEWTGEGDGTNWSDGANWEGGVPNGAGSVANLLDGAGGGTVTRDVAVTVGTLVLDGAQGYTIAGPMPLTLEDGAGALIDATGEHAIGGTVILGSDVTVDVDGTLTIGPVEGSGRDVTKTGTGTLVLDGGGTAETLNLEDGVVRVTGDFRNWKFGRINFGPAPSLPVPQSLQAVPEPASVMLLAAGALGLLRRRR